MLQVNGGQDPNGCGLYGFVGSVRIEAFNNIFSGTGATTRGTPYNLFVPTSGPTMLRVASVDGHALSSPTGSFTAADVQIATSGTVPVIIEASQIPVGTTVELHLFSENGNDQVLVSPGLQGTLAASSTTLQVTFPLGFTRGYPRAVWR